MFHHQEYKISGVSVFFPCKPYPSQFSMMDKIIKGIERRQNCLLESPTGSGKSLALLCSSLAWQTAEKAKKDQAEAEEAEKALCLCECHTEGGVKPDTSPPKSDVESKPISVDQKREASITDKSNTHGWPNFDFPPEEDDDFKTDEKKFNVQPDKKGPRNHISISYEEEVKAEKTKDAGSPCKLCSCDNGEEKPKIKIPKIYFGTRTHKQVAQIVKELRKTAYQDVKMTILGSREHTCIHPEVSRMKNKNDGCKELLNDAGCHFKDGTLRLTSQRIIKDNGLSTAWDLEDLVQMCKPKRACPYFLARGLKEDADLIICPYNYLVDPMVRDAMSISVKGHIIILDEAHNIEDSAREAASQSITQDSILKAIKDIESLIEANINLADHSKLRSMLKNLDTFIDENKGKLEQKDFDKSYKLWTGFYIVAQLESLGLGPKFYPELKSALATVKAEAEERKEEAIRAGLSLDTVEMKPSSQGVLEQIFQILDYLYRADLKYVDDYRASLVQSYSFVPSAHEGQWLNSRNRHGGRNMTQVETHTLNFWCMNPGVAFSDFAETRSIILTSGTLSPLTSFESELGLEFKIHLEANHVIKDSQVWVGTIGQGPSGASLQAVFRNLETFQFQDELGGLILKVCETVPHGVLCFLPSYKVLEKLTRRWESTSLMQRIGRKKRIISEPRGSDKVDFEEQMKIFYETMKPGKGGLDESECEDEDDQRNGAIFFAVCRGKVSEGLDFADNFARAVITVGIPYPNFKDVQVELKRKYNDQHRQKGLLSGHEWYEIQAFRALNQALGRCIRHRNDWGALIIVDDRFVKSAAKYNKGLSKWVRNKIQTFQDFPCAMDSLSQFTTTRLEIQEKEPCLDLSLASTPSTSQSPRKPLHTVNSLGTPVTPHQNFSSPYSGHNSAKKALQNFSIFNLPPVKQQGLTSHNSPKPNTSSRDQMSGYLNNSCKDSVSFPTSSNTMTPSAKLATKMKGHPSTPEVPNTTSSTSSVTSTVSTLATSSASCVSSSVNTDSAKIFQPTFLRPPMTLSIPSAGVTTSTLELWKQGTSTAAMLSNLEVTASSTSAAAKFPASGPTKLQRKVLASAWSADPPSCVPQNKDSKIQLRIVTEKAAPGVRFKIFHIPPNLHKVFGGNLKLPVSTKDRLVYLVDPPPAPGQNPLAKLIRMSEEEKEAILSAQQSLNNQVCPTIKVSSSESSNNDCVAAPTSISAMPMVESSISVIVPQDASQTPGNSVTSSSTVGSGYTRTGSGGTTPNTSGAVPSAGAVPSTGAIPNAVVLSKGTVPNYSATVTPPTAGNTPLSLLASQTMPSLFQMSTSTPRQNLILGSSPVHTPSQLGTASNIAGLGCPKLVSILQKQTKNLNNAVRLVAPKPSHNETILLGNNDPTKPALPMFLCPVTAVSAQVSGSVPTPVISEAVPSLISMVTASSRVPFPGVIPSSPIVLMAQSVNALGSNCIASSSVIPATNAKPLQATGKKLLFKQNASKNLTNTVKNSTVASPKVGGKTAPQNTRKAAPKSTPAPSTGPSSETDEEDSGEKLQIKRKSKARKRKTLLLNKNAAKKSKESCPKPQNKLPETVDFKCKVCGHKLLGGKLPSDFQEQRTTPPFLRTTDLDQKSEKTAEKKAPNGSIFFPGNTARGGLQALADNTAGLNTKYVEQEDICVQFLYCGQCLKAADTTAEAVGAQVQLAAGSGARFSKGQIWLFANKVTQDPEN